ncbi:hypothetical protein [Rhodoplanes roseus]|uniref:Uncharacterized protein n=1 Tax=Rhodoplanes roseus TaxID=29409 RepID=A0A327L3I6_9BRAD|nr:hypothetical protein [Rhodoplanes roseus]RAI44957.1 hypothetical protein CH341_06290 [Rhodoplanes roseus]
MAAPTIALDFTPLARTLTRVRDRWTGLSVLCLRGVRAFADPYRPEAHYMRGPGPKWHAKHGGAGARR